MAAGRRAAWALNDAARKRNVFPPASGSDNAGKGRGWGR